MQNPYINTPEDRLLVLYQAVKNAEYQTNSEFANLKDPQARQYIINEVERRAKQ